MQHITVGQALKIARDHHKAGEFPEAEAACRKLLGQKPNQPDALHLLGFMTANRNRPEGIAMIQRAIEIDPRSAEYHNNLGCVLYAGQQYNDAIAAYRKALALRPDYPEAWYNLGTALVDADKSEEAVTALRKAVELRPTLAEAQKTLIATLRALDRPDEAIAAAEAAIAACPDSAEALNALGMSHFDKDEDDQAMSALRRAVALSPESASARVNLAIVLRKKGEFIEAIAASRQAIELEPTNHFAWLSLGNCLRSNHEYQDAENAYRKVNELRPDYSDGFTNLGAALRDLCRFDESRRAFYRAVALKPDSAPAHWNYALSLLLAGDFTNGWVEYEWRWIWKQFTNTPRRYPQPRWYGADPAGKTVFIFSEQGFGDLVQFCRYIPLLAERGARVVLECPPEMRRLMGSLEGAAEVRIKRDGPPAFDCYTPIMSLPLGFNTMPDTIPAKVPYLHADAELIGTWSARMPVNPGQLRVGLVWAGQPKHGDDRKRSLALSSLAPLARASHARFFSLQKGAASVQISNPPAGMELTDLGPDLKDFADTAAVMANLDLIITVDTSVAHLAGALGKPCWVLLASVPDWRWLLDREDTPWYPTLRLFRQAVGGTWEPVLERMAGELSAFEKST